MAITLKLPSPHGRLETHYARVIGTNGFNNHGAGYTVIARFFPSREAFYAGAGQSYPELRLKVPCHDHVNRAWPHLYTQLKAHDPTAEHRAQLASIEQVIAQEEAKVGPDPVVIRNLQDTLAETQARATPDAGAIAELERKIAEEQAKADPEKVTALQRDRDAEEAKAAPDEERLLQIQGLLKDERAKADGDKIAGWLREIDALKLPALQAQQSANTLSRRLRAEQAQVGPSPQKIAFHQGEHARISADMAKLEPLRAGLAAAEDCTLEGPPVAAPLA